MSLWSRFTNLLRGEKLSREIEEELDSHLQEAAHSGRDPVEARRALGPALQYREESRDLRLIPWLESLRADGVFGWRQLLKRKTTSAAAVLSLGLAIGSCASAFRLIDALLLRPMPVSDPQSLFAASRRGIGPEGKPQSTEEWAYPLFRQMRTAVEGQAEMIATSDAERTDLTFKTDDEMEKAYVQYVSGWMFGSFGLRPAAGRLFTANDDATEGAHPYAVLSHDYWSRRFGQDPGAVGRTFHLGNRVYEIAGVVDGPFSGTTTGTAADIFLPSMMHPFAGRSDATFTRILARLHPGVAIGPVRERLQAVFQGFERERAKRFTGMSRQRIDNFLNQTVELEPAAAGASGMQKNLRTPLRALSVLVSLLLLVASVNVANLMIAQASARSREMALRVSIGAGRKRLVQLMLVESAWVALLSAAVGGLFAWWSAPFVVSRINPPDNPVRMTLPADWRVFGFGLALTLLVTLLFGLAPALRASAVRPSASLRGGEDPHASRRLMHLLIAAQVGFCVLVLFAAGLFVATFDRLSNQPTGFSTARLLVLDTEAHIPQPAGYWDQVLERLQNTPGVESAALADWALMNGNSRNNFISVSGAPVTEALTYFRYISPGWLDLMRIRLIDGRDFRPSDASPGAAIVNETFAKVYCNGENPVGKWFDRGAGMRYQIVGLVADARYRNMREPMLPVAFVPIHATGADGAMRPLIEGTFVVRTASQNPAALASILRREVTRVRPELRVSNIHTQAEINRKQTVRERLLAMLALFFAVVALILAGVGLYGVLDYSVVQRRREIGIRMAIGAQAIDVARRITTNTFLMVLGGALVGLASGLALAGSVASLLYQIKPTDAGMLVLPAGAILATALLAGVPAIIRAVSIDPARILRSE